jgi:formylglycine-generating enzyme required for sulfatase activity
MANLSGGQIETLQQTLLDAFDYAALEELLLFGLDRRLDQIAGQGHSLRAIVLDVITLAEREGWTANLLHAVAEARPNLPALQAVVRDLLSQAEAPGPPRADGAAFERAKPFEPETVLAPAGTFLMGAGPADALSPHESPQHPVLLAEHRIGRFPVTNSQYREYLRQERAAEPPRDTGWFLREPPRDRLDHPVAGVSWNDAVAYCQWLSRVTGRHYRLPTEAEWEKAASWEPAQDSAASGRKRRYPWGDEFAVERCNVLESGIGATTPCAHYGDAGASAYGCRDMIGNVQEWVSTAWGGQRDRPDFPYPYRPDDGREYPDVDPRVLRVHRGGAYRDPAARVRCTARAAAPPDSRLAWRGFRVVMDVT